MRRKSIFGVILLVLAVCGSVQGRYSGGTGDVNEPYLISTPADMDAIGDNPTDWDKAFILTADINMADYVYTAALIAPDTDNSNYDFDGTAFTGIFEGNNHKIISFTIDAMGARNNYLGLFGYIGTGGQVKYLGVEDLNITDRGYQSHNLGGLVGYNRYGIISNCCSTGAVKGGHSSQRIGGLVGKNYHGIITDCSSSCTVTATGGSRLIGGLVGYNEEGSIIDCYATGSVSSDKYSRYLGGLCGISVEGSISDCYATGSVDGYFEVGGLFGRSGEGFSNCYATGSVGGYYWVGGLIGFTRYTEYQNCYATGSVSGYHWVGGLVGENHSRISNCYAAGEVSSWNNSREIGGLIGLNGALISNCYAVGQVTSGDDSYDIGGLAGSNGGAFRNCFWDVNSSGLDTSDGGEGKTTTEMQTESTFTGAGWDFGSPVWFIDEGVDYPRLWWEMLEPTELLGMLADDVVGLVGHEAIANSLLAKIDAAIEKLDDGNAKNDKAGVNMLEAFVNAVKAQRGKKISGDDADYLVAGAEQIIGMVNGDCEKPPE